MSSIPPRRPAVRKVRSGLGAKPAPIDQANDDCDAADLIRRCREGEEAAWELFLARYGRLIYATILKVGLPSVEQEEAFQETIVAVFRQLDRLRENDRLISWIVGIAWRQSINRIRSRSRERGREELDEEHLSSLEAYPGEHPADQMRLTLEQAQQAQEGLAALPERCRRLLGYLFYEEPPPDYAEISRREGIPIGSLGPTRARCLEKLRSYYEKRGWA